MTSSSPELSPDDFLLSSLWLSNDSSKITSRCSLTLSLKSSASFFLRGAGAYENDAARGFSSSNKGLWKRGCLSEKLHFGVFPREGVNSAQSTTQILSLLKLINENYFAYVLSQKKKKLFRLALHKSNMLLSCSNIFDVNFKETKLIRYW